MTTRQTALILIAMVTALVSNSLEAGLFLMGLAVGAYLSIILE
jgi:hypothetical protein